MSGIVQQGANRGGVTVTGIVQQRANRGGVTVTVEEVALFWAAHRWNNSKLFNRVRKAHGTTQNYLTGFEKFRTYTNAFKRSNQYVSET